MVSWNIGEQAGKETIGRGSFDRQPDCRWHRLGDTCWIVSLHVHSRSAIANQFILAQDFLSVKRKFEFALNFYWRLIVRDWRSGPRDFHSHQADVVAEPAVH